MSRSGASPTSGMPGTMPRALMLVAAVALAAAGCDDELKYVDTFAFMVDGPAVETYEQQPRPWPEGAVPVDGQRSYSLTEADTALTNPLEPTTANIQAGRQAWTNYCLPCHGKTGAGDGPVINNSGDYPRRLPYIPTANLLSDRTRGYTDGYIYGMITNGRGFMPGYSRIPRETRWQLVTYVRHLQRTAAQQSDGASQGGSSQSTENDGE